MKNGVIPFFCGGRDTTGLGERDAHYTEGDPARTFQLLWPLGPILVGALSSRHRQVTIRFVHKSIPWLAGGVPGRTIRPLNESIEGE